MNKKIWIGALSGLCALTFGVGAYSVKNVQAGASESAVEWTGFAIDATAVRTANPTGLRFRTVAERLTPSMKKYNPDAEYYTTLTFTAAGGQSYTTEVPATVWREDGSGWNTVLLEIPESDYVTAVTAQSFVKLNGRENAFYQTEPVTISIAQTAAAAISYGAESAYVGEYIENIVTGVALDKSTASMEAGQTVALTATTTPSGYMAKWTSSDTSIATVDNYGNVKGKGVGTATITAQINGYTASCQVTVTARTETLSGFASSVSFSFLGDRTVTISGSWLDSTFADERIDAFTCDVEATKAMDLKADSGYTIGLSADTAKNITFTRSMYDAWKASGESNLVIKSDLSTIYSGKLTFSNFAKVWAKDESQVLTGSALSALEGYIPDYSFNSAQFNFFGYSSLTDGSYYQYDLESGETTKCYGDEDYRNIYRIEEYKDAGMTVLFPQSSCVIAANEGDSFDFSTSKLKEVMDMALEADLAKVILTDRRLYALCEDTTGSIIGQGKAFATEAELDVQIKTYMQPYVNHPAFYGVMLLDEPNYTELTAQGEVYRAIKRCYPNAYVQCNLHPATATIGEHFDTPTQTLIDKYTALGYSATLAERFAAYEQYLTTFLDNTGANYVMYDNYPFRETGMQEYYVGTMQVVANICAERNVRFQFVSQTMTMQNGKTSTYSELLTEEHLRYLNNMQLGFGVKQLAYFTYFTKQAASESERFVDGGSFITHAGEKTDIYYYMREILQENQAFANTVLSFDYRTSATYTANGVAYSAVNAQNCSKGNFMKLNSVTVNTESSLVTELYDAINNRYMYMAQNITNPAYQSMGTLQTVTLQFDANYQYAVVWENGERSVVKLTNGEYVVKLNCGEAVYVIPFNLDEGGQDGYVQDKANGDNGAWWPNSDNGNSTWRDAE